MRLEFARNVELNIGEENSETWLSNLTQGGWPKSVPTWGVDSLCFGPSTHDLVLNFHTASGWRTEVPRGPGELRLESLGASRANGGVAEHVLPGDQLHH